MEKGKRPEIASLPAGLRVDLFLDCMDEFLDNYNPKIDVTISSLSPSLAINYEWPGDEDEQQHDIDDDPEVDVFSLPLLTASNKYHQTDTVGTGKDFNSWPLYETQVTSANNTAVKIRILAHTQDESDLKEIHKIFEKMVAHYRGNIINELDEDFPDGIRNSHPDEFSPYGAVDLSNHDYELCLHVVFRPPQAQGQDPV